MKSKERNKSTHTARNKNGRLERRKKCVCCFVAKKKIILPCIFCFIYNVCEMRMCVGYICPHTGFWYRTIFSLTLSVSFWVPPIGSFMCDEILCRKIGMELFVLETCLLFPLNMPVDANTTWPYGKHTNWLSLIYPLIYRIWIVCARVYISDHHWNAQNFWNKHISFYNYLWPTLVIYINQKL